MSDRGRLRPSSGAGLDGAHLSDSPRRSPRITHSVTSPVRSVHPEQMESLGNHADFGMRTTDFFDHASSDEDTVEHDTHDSGLHAEDTITPGQWRKIKLAEERRSLQPESDGYRQLEPARDMMDTSRFSAETPSTDFNGSVDELLPDQPSSPPEYPRAARLSGRALQRPRSSMAEPRSEPAQRSSSVMPVSKNNAGSKLDQVLSAHAIAHEITLHALMRDEEALDRSLQTFAPMHPGERGSLLPASLRFNDPRSPSTLRNISTPTGTSAPTPVSTAKRVTMLPPRIDTTAKNEPRHSLPADMIRTPYPFTPPQNANRKDLNTLHPPPSSPPSLPPPPADSILTLSIRRSNPHSRLRITTLTIHAADPVSVPHLPRSAQRKYRLSLFLPISHGFGLDYDDEVLFLALRRSYASLVGPWRFLSARSLRSIRVSGSASKAADVGYGWLAQPRSPRVLASKGLSDTFGEEKILELFRKPKGGRRRFAFVGWARRLAGAEAGGGRAEGDEEEGELVRRREQLEGLEFVLAWSVGRISVALLLVLLASVAATLCWVLLGRNTLYMSSPDAEWSVVGAGGGFRGAGDRIAAGLAMGTGILLLGLSGIAGWLGVSWCVM